jgi:DNA polymerase kappa
MVVVNPYAKKKRLQDESDNDTKSAPPAAAALSSYTTTTTATAATTAPSLSSSSASALVISASDKAGMQGIDRAKIDEIILRESGNSLFMQQQRKRDEKVDQKIQQLKIKLLKDQSSSSSSSSHTHQSSDPKLIYSNASRATCVVVDMDMFYMACELLTRPEIHQRPACVGSGMILTSNYKARRYGVRSAMPGFLGDKLVEILSQGKEQLVHVPHHFDLYQRKSKEVLQILSQFDPHLKSCSLDEAYLDLGPYMTLKLQHNADDDYWTHEQIHAALVGTKMTTTEATSTSTTSNSNIADATQRCETIPEQHDDNDPVMMKQPNNTPSFADSDATTTTSATTTTITKMEYMNILQSYSSQVCLNLASSIVADMRGRVHQVTGLTCSAGLAPNFMLAKIGSDCNKPNGQLCVDPQGVLEFVHPLPLRKIPGVGRVTEKILQAFGMYKVQDLYDQRGLVQALFQFQPATTKFLLRASVGCDSGGGGDGEEDSEEPSSSSQKGMSRERTFSPQDSWTELTRLLEGIAAILSEDLVRKNLLAHTITVKAKLHTFDVLSKSQSLARGVYIQTPHDLATLGTELLKQLRAQYLYADKSKSRPFSLRLLGIRCSNLVENNGGGEMANQPAMDKFLEPNHHHDSKTEETDTGWPASPYKNHHPVSTLAVTTSKRKAPTLAELFERSISKASEMASKQSDDQVDSWPSSCDDGRLVTPVATDKTVERMTDDSYKADNHAGADVNSIEEVDSPTLFEEVQCPLCNRKIEATDNGALNRHIDSCLSASAIRQVVREESAVPQEKKKKQRLTDFW